MTCKIILNQILEGRAVFVEAEGGRVIHPFDVTDLGSRNLETRTKLEKDSKIPPRIPEFEKAAAKLGDSLGADYVLVPYPLRSELEDEVPLFRQFFKFYGIITPYIKRR